MKKILLSAVIAFAMFSSSAVMAWGDVVSANSNANGIATSNAALMGMSHSTVGSVAGSYAATSGCGYCGSQTSMTETWGNAGTQSGAIGFAAAGAVGAYNSNANAVNHNYGYYGW